MAGLGSRFVTQGYEQIKPLIEVRPGVPMIEAVVDSIGIVGNFVFIVQKKHLEETNVEEVLRRIRPNCEIATVDGLTEGAACTVLSARQHISTDEPLIIVNSDNILDWDGAAEFEDWINNTVADGMIAVFESTDPRYSYVRLDAAENIVEVAEKKVISDVATAGLYVWANAKDFFDAAERMIAMDDRVNGEFYVAPVYNHNLAIVPWFEIVPAPVREFIGVGTPEELAAYKARNVQP